MTFEDWWTKEFSNVNIHFYENSSDTLTKEWFNIVKQAFEDGKSSALAAKDARIAELEKGSGFRLMPGESLQTKTDINGRVISACIMAVNGEPAPDGMARMAVLAAQQQAEPKCSDGGDCGIGGYCKECPLTATHSEDGREVKRWALSLYNDCGGYSPKMVDPETLPNPETRTRYVLESDYLECKRIVEGIVSDCWAACGGNGPATLDDLLTALRLMDEAEDEQERIVASKDAEIARLNSKIETMRNKNNEYYEQLASLRAQPARQVDGDSHGPARQVGDEQIKNDSDALVIISRGVLAAAIYAIREKKDAPVIIEKLRKASIGDEVHYAALAPVSSQVGGDERAAFNAWNNGTDCPLAGRDTKTGAWMAWQARAALVPAAMVVMPTHKSTESGFDGQRTFSLGYNSALNEVTRLNRRAIPVDELEALSRDAGRYRWLRTYAYGAMVDHEIGDLFSYDDDIIDEKVDELRALLGKEG